MGLFSWIERSVFVRVSRVCVIDMNNIYIHIYIYIEILSSCGFVLNGSLFMNVKVSFRMCIEGLCDRYEQYIHIYIYISIKILSWSGFVLNGSLFMNFKVSFRMCIEVLCCEYEQYIHTYISIYRDFELEWFCVEWVSFHGFDSLFSYMYSGFVWYIYICLRMCIWI